MRLTKVVPAALLAVVIGCNPAGLTSGTGKVKSLSAYSPTQGDQVMCADPNTGIGVSCLTFAEKDEVVGEAVLMCGAPGENPKEYGRANFTCNYNGDAPNPRMMYPCETKGMICYLDMEADGVAVSTGTFTVIPNGSKQ